MTVSNQQEYKLPSGEIISIQLNEKIWEVACWTDNDECRWYKEYSDEALAKKEYERWKHNATA